MIDACAKNQAIRVRGEIAGLPLPEGPVLWCADAMVVTLRAKLPNNARHSEDYAVHIPGQMTYFAEGLSADRADPGVFHITFRLPVPDSSTSMEVLWKTKLLGEAHVEIITEAEYLKELKCVEFAVGPVYDRGTAVAVTFSNSGLKGVFSSITLQNKYTLAALAKLHVKVFLQFDTPVFLTTQQLIATTKTLNSVLLRFRKSQGRKPFAWRVGTKEMVNTNLYAISDQKFQTKIKVQSARHVWSDEKGKIRVTTTVPAPNAKSAAAQFTVKVDSLDAAGLVEWEIRIGERSLKKGTVLVTTGGVSIATELYSWSELPREGAWAFYVADKQIASLPRGEMEAPPFSAEGGFVKPVDVVWSPSNESELLKRLEGLK